MISAENSNVQIRGLLLNDEDISDPYLLRSIGTWQQQRKIQAPNVRSTLDSSVVRMVG